MKQFVLFLSFIFCLNITINGQTTASRGEELSQQAEVCLQQKEHIKARYLYLQAYRAFAGKEEYTQAIECGVQVSALYRRENYYKEASEFCNTMEQFVLNGEQKQNKTFPDLRFLINKERLQMNVSLKRPAQAKEILNRLEENAKAAHNDSINENLLYTQASYYYTFGMPEQGDAYFQKMIEQQKNQAKIDECYKKIIDNAQKSNNTKLLAHTYEKYMAWADSAQALSTQDKFNVLKQEYDESLQTIKQKEDTLSAKQYIIIGLCVLVVILAAALILGGMVLLRFVFLTRKQKKAIQIANEHNESKTLFIQNISTQMEPTLNTLDASLPGVQALRGFSEHIQTLSELENSLSEIYEMQTIPINPFCESVMSKIEGQIKVGVAMVVNAPKLNVKTNPEQLERILLHLLKNAAEFTPEGGKISLDFKKRGAYTHQFIVTDSGRGVPVEAHENLFKPFTEVKDLTQGDGLGLPICSLIATKMNGTLTLDKTYTRGCRFILELHT